MNRCALRLLLALVLVCATATASGAIVSSPAARRLDVGVFGRSSPVAAAAAAASSSSASRPPVAAALATETDWRAQATQIMTQIKHRIENAQDTYDQLAHGVGAAIHGFHSASAALIKVASAHVDEAATTSADLAAPAAGSHATTELFWLTEAQEAAILEEYRTSKSSLGMHDRSPKFKSEKLDFDTDYIISIAIYLAIGAGIGIVQLLFTGIYMFFRCCCWRWACKKRSDYEQPGFLGYPTFWKKYWTSAFLIGFVVIACAFAIVGLVFNNKLSSSFSDSNQEHGLGPLVLNIIDSMRSIIDNMVDLVQDLSDVITNNVTNISNQIANALPSDIDTQASTLTTETSTFGSIYAGGYAVSANGTMWYCDATCAILAAASTAMSSQISDQVVTVIDQYQNIISTLQDDFVDEVSDIQSQLSDAKSSLSDAQGDVLDDGTRKDVDNASSDVSKYNGIRNPVFIALFSVTFLAPVLTLAGLAFKKAGPLKALFVLGPFFMFIMWILMGIHWASGMFIGDACIYIDDHIVTLNTTLSDSNGNLVDVVNSCLTNTSIVTALDLEKYLDFQTLAVFPAVFSQADIDSMFNTSSLDTMVALGATLTTASFGLDETTSIDNYITEMSTILTDSSTTVTYMRWSVQSCASDLTTCYTSKYSGANLDDILSLQQQAMDGMDVYVAVTLAISQINSNLTEIQSSTNTLISSFSSANATIASLQSTLDSTVYPIINEFRAITCYDIAVDFRQFKGELCNTVGNSVQWITFALFMIGLSCFGITWCGRWSSYRVKFVPRIAPAPFQDQAWVHAQQVPPNVAVYSPGDNSGYVQMSSPPAQQDQYASYAAGGQSPPVPAYDPAFAAYKTPEVAAAEENDTYGNATAPEADDGDFTQEQAEADAAAAALASPSQ